MKRHIKTILFAALLSANAQAAMLADHIPLDGGWGHWCETDPYTLVTVCAWIRDNPGQGGGRNNKGKGRPAEHPHFERIEGGWCLRYWPRPIQCYRRDAK